MENYIDLINEQYKIIHENKNYLNDTDYKVIRELDGGEAVDDATRKKRAEARKIINDCEALIKEMEVAMQKELDNQPEIINIPSGIILVTGATGSGKSTTVYSILQKINRTETNLITVEDPIEMNIN